MNKQVNKFLHLPLVAGGIAVILVSGIAIASVAISGQGVRNILLPADALGTAALAVIDAPGSRANRCSECGVIESMRELNAAQEKTGIEAPGGIAAGRSGGIEVKPLRNYEITIRLQDGTMRVIRDAKPAKWRHGEPVTIIAGADE